MKSFRLFGATFLCSLIILFSSCAILFLLFPDTENTIISTSSESYYPKTEDNLSIILIGGNTEQINDCFFTLLRFDAKQHKVTLAGLPADTEINIGTASETLFRHFQMNGGMGAVRAVRQLLRVNVDRYAVLGENSLITIADSLGGVEYELTENIITKNMKLSKGLQMIDGKRFQDLILMDNHFTFDLSLTKALLDQRVNPSLIGRGEALFQKITAAAETNLSAYDYGSRKNALTAWAESPEEKASVFTFDGTYQEKQKTYLISTESIEAYRKSVYQIGVED